MLSNDGAMMTDSVTRRGPMSVVPQGSRVRVRVPASSANLGPGFDTLGLALGLYDEVSVEVTAGGLAVDVVGEGAGEVVPGPSHLVVRAFRRGLEAAGLAVDGLNMLCRNTIPHSRGLGSSASAVVAGLAAAAGLEQGLTDAPVLTTDRLVQLAAEFEGHPDNSSASILGGAVVSWTEFGPSGERHYRAERLYVHPELSAWALVPADRSSTSMTRGMLPPTVPHRDAAFNAGRAALAVVALERRPDLLFAATEDRLHQGYRAPALPMTTRWVERLRAAGFAATVSGAGPTVLALSTEPIDDGLLDRARGEGLTVHRLAIAEGVSVESDVAPYRS